jgi:hypothetical protein
MWHEVHIQLRCMCLQQAKIGEVSCLKVRCSRAMIVS